MNQDSYNRVITTKPCGTRVSRDCYMHFYSTSGISINHDANIVIDTRIAIGINVIISIIACIYIMTILSQPSVLLLLLLRLLLPILLLLLHQQQLLLLLLQQLLQLPCGWRKRHVNGLQRCLTQRLQIQRMIDSMLYGM